MKGTLYLFQSQFSRSQVMPIIIVQSSTIHFVKGTLLWSTKTQKMYIFLLQTFLEHQNPACGSLVCSLSVGNSLKTL